MRIIQDEGSQNLLLVEFEAMCRSIRRHHRRGAGGGRMVEITHVVANQVPPRHRAGGARPQRISPQNTFLGRAIICKCE